MVSFMKAYQEQTYALLRITTGFMFLFHGTQKMLGVSTGKLRSASTHPVCSRSD